MRTRFHKISPLACSALCSILAHILLICSLRVLAQYDFGTAVNRPAALMVELATAPKALCAESGPLPGPKRSAAEAPAGLGPEPMAQRGAALAEQLAERVEPEPARSGMASETEGPDLGDETEPSAAEYAWRARLASWRRSRLVQQHQPQPVPAAPGPESSRPAAQAVHQRAAVQGAAASGAPAGEPPGSAAMLNAVSDSLAARYEKLSYVISMHGLPIAHAELESRNEQNVIAITLKIRSNAATSGLFPVDNEIETRHVDGRFIMTTIRQREGSFQSDQSFTINLRKKVVSWTGSNSRPLELPLPSDDLLDTLSGIYYLRSRPLQVGSTETLHIFDSESYAEVPVQVLRREETRLANLTRVDTLVLRPQRSAGILRGTGEVLIWMTDDDCKVPVKIVTSSALGEVTAELVSAQSKSHEEGSGAL